MADNNVHLIHANSMGTKIDGTPKLPSADRIEYGEIAVNYLHDNETLSIKNNRNEIVSFSCDAVRDRESSNKKFYEEAPYVTCTYTTTTTDEAVEIISRNFIVNTCNGDFDVAFNSFRAITIDGQPTLSNQVSGGVYTFAEAGEHVVKYYLDNTKVIDKYMFSGLMFTKCVLPDSVRLIDERAFETCGAMTDIIMGEKLSVLAEKSFRNCVSLLNITIEAMIPPAVTATTPLFADAASGYSIFVHKNVISTYNSASGWTSLPFAEIDYTA